MTKKEIAIAKENVRLLAHEILRRRKLTAAETSLREFIKLAWPVVEPGKTFVPGWHIDAISDHLEAVTEGDIRQLIINMPPRHMKSSIVSIMYPAWVWIKKPQTQFLFASYAESLSLTLSRKCRQLIKSPWYQNAWNSKFQLVSDQNEKRRFDNDKMGYRLATSVDGSNTGEGGDIICVTGDTAIMTDRGPIAIEKIVNEKLPVRVLGSSGTFQEILTYQRNPGKPILEFEFETGEKLRCTENHPLFVESGGYIPAKDVARMDFGVAKLRRIPLGSSSVSIIKSKVAGSAKANEVVDVVGFGAPIFPEFLKGDNVGNVRIAAKISLCSSAFLARILVSFKNRSTCSAPSVSIIAFPSIPMRAIAGFKGNRKPFEPALVTTEPRGLSEWMDEKRSAALFADAFESARMAFLRAMHFLDCDRLRLSKFLSASWADFSYFSLSAFAGAGFSKMCMAGPNQELSTTSLADFDDLRLSDHGLSSCYQYEAPETTRIASVRRCPAPDFVYNLGVAPDHDYYANGILTHNCYDDPNNVKDANSEAQRVTANDWHDQVMTSRLNDPQTGCRIVIQQRCHEQDVTGHLLEKGGWELLILPAEYEGSKKVTSIGWSDPRTEIGEFLWPARFGKTEIDALKLDLGEMGAAGQLQQRPSPGEGAMFKREWFNYWNPPTVDIDPATREFAPVVVKNPGKQTFHKKPVSLPIAFEQIIQSWDFAFKGESDSDFVSGQVWGRVGANFYLLHHVHGRMDFPATVKAFRKCSEEFPCPEKLVEDKANGPAVVATLKNEIPGIIAVIPDGGKIARANAVAPYVESGNVYLPNPDLYSWVDAFIEEHANFPRGKNDDSVDSLSMACRRLADSMANCGVPEFRVMPRIGEPDTACHIAKDLQLQPHWRRWIAVAPGEMGAAVWVCETPSGSLRVYREMELEGMDAFEVGRRIAEATLPDVRAFMWSVHLSAKWQIDVLMEKVAFAPIEPIGSYAEALEQGILGYDPTEGTWEERQRSKADLKQAKFSAQIGVLEDSAFDRLRDLLRFKPADYEEMPYDRRKAFKLAEQDIHAYTAYMNSVQGIIPGEYPRLKIAADCKQVVAAMGSNRRDDEISDPFMRALLISMTAPPQPLGIKTVREVPAHTLQSRGAFNRTFRRAM